ncbi:MAG: hypothetical protein R3F50_11125 [Gammaproteobacteria bacterium]|jgi:hypothetical protein
MLLTRRVSRRPGYVGAGSVDLAFFAVLALSLGAGLVSARRRV